MPRYSNNKRSGGLDAVLRYQDGDRWRTGSKNERNTMGEANGGFPMVNANTVHLNRSEQYYNSSRNNDREGLRRYQRYTNSRNQSYKGSSPTAHK